MWLLYNSNGDLVRYTTSAETAELWAEEYNQTKEEVTQPMEFIAELLEDIFVRRV